MCAYLGIDLQREFFLLPVAKRAVEAPLPAQWQEQRDEANDRSVFVDADGGIHERHPMDDSFKQSVCFYSINRTTLLTLFQCTRSNVSLH